jgi:hypothetical protein
MCSAIDRWSEASEESLTAATASKEINAQF